MSSLTEVVLTIAGYPDPGLREALIAPVDHSGQHLSRLDTNAAGGYKVFCDSVYAACFNHVIPEDVHAFLSAIDWGYQQAVVVIDYEHAANLEVHRYGAERVEDRW